MVAFKILALAMGVASGAAAGWIWLRASARLGDDRVWPRLRELTRSLVSSDSHERFARQYVETLPILGRYLGKQLVTVMLSCAPIILAYTMLQACVIQVIRQNVTHVEITPPQAMTVSIGGHTLRLDEKPSRIPDSPDLDGSAVVSTNAGVFHCPTLLRKQAYTPCWLGRVFWFLLGFTILHPEGPDSGAGGQRLLLQPSSGDGNFLWPYLTDWELNFLEAVSLASAASVLFLKARRR